MNLFQQTIRLAQAACNRRAYSLCGPPRRPPGPCGCGDRKSTPPVDCGGGGRKPSPPVECGGGQKPAPPVESACGRCGGRKPGPPVLCGCGRPAPVPARIAPNPCCPVYHHGQGTWKPYKYLFLLLLPVILIHTLNCLSHCPHPKGECRDYEYMRRRTKRFPWGDGTKSLFHNDEFNHLPGDCTPAALDCD